jgi:hypothetical protein
MGAAACAGLLVSCAQVSDAGLVDVGTESTWSTATTQDPARVREAHTPGWSNWGEKLIADKREGANHPYYGDNLLNKGDWAYQSLPVDVSAPGPLVVRVPVPTDFDFPKDPLAFGMSTPFDQSFRWTLTSEPRLVDADGERVLELPGEVIELPQIPFEPYPRYSLWIS